MSLFIGRLSRARMLSKGAGLGSSKTSFGLFSALEKSTKEDHIPRLDTLQEGKMWSQSLYSRLHQPETLPL